MNITFTPFEDDEYFPSDKTIAEVNAKIEECIAKIETALPQWKGSISRPTVKYDLEGHTAGYAIGSHTIRLNLYLIRTHREDMINQTLPHEVAHIVCHQMYPGQRVAHGYKWAYIMEILGLEARRCHQYETVAKRRRPRPHRYVCNCSEHYVTDTLHTRIQSGRTYTCRKCKGVLR